jgi:hypothetical protein
LKESHTINLRPESLQAKDRLAALPPWYVPHSTTAPGIELFSSVEIIANCSRYEVALTIFLLFRTILVNSFSLSRK